MVQRMPLIEIMPPECFRKFKEFCKSYNDRTLIVEVGKGNHQLLKERILQPYESQLALVEGKTWDLDYLAFLICVECGIR